MNVGIRPMTERDLPFADSLRAQAGWNQTISDWRRLLSHDPQGCFVAEREREPVGTITTTTYSHDLAWIGMLLVSTAHRNQGIGQALLHHAIGYLRSLQVKCIKLDATPAGRPLYEKIGFQCEWKFRRWDCSRPRKLGKFPSGVRAVCDKDMEAIAGLDQASFGAGRASWLKHLTRNATCVLADDAKPGLKAFGVLREGARAMYLGPIVAASFQSAAAVISGLASKTNGAAAYWDLPDFQTEAVELARKLGFVPQRELVRMCLGPNVGGNLAWLYGIGSPESG